MPFKKRKFLHVKQGDAKWLCRDEEAVMSDSPAGRMDQKARLRGQCAGRKTSRALDPLDDV